MKKSLRYFYSLIFIWILSGCGVGVVLTPPEPDQFPHYKSDCINGDTNACLILGNMYKDGVGTAQNLHEAKNAYTKACQAKVSEACSELGKLFSEKQRPSNVTIKSRKNEDDNLNASKFQNIKQLCNSGNYEECYTLGKMYEKEIGTKKNYFKAYKAYKVSCESSNKNTLKACYSLGRLYNDGLGIRRSYKRAKKLFKHTCKSDYARGCGELGSMYLYGKGVAQNSILGIKLLEKGCSNGNIKSCTTLGTLFVTGEGVAEDYNRAYTFFDKACSRGDALACFNMGNIYENGIGRAQNKESAKEFYSAACRLGLKESCNSLVNLK